MEMSSGSKSEISLHLKTTILVYSTCKTLLNYFICHLIIDIFFEKYSYSQLNGYINLESSSSFGLRTVKDKTTVRLATPSKLSLIMIKFNSVL